MLEQLLFEPYPFGAGMDRSQWDMESLEDLGELLVEEGITTHVRPEGGKTIESAIVDVLADLSVLIPRNPITGLMTFVPVREPSGDIAYLNEHLLTDPLPELTQVFGDTKTPTEAVFTFRDRKAKFEPAPIGHDNAGRVFYEQWENSKNVNLATCRDFNSAATCASRRAQEELAQKVAVRINALRGAREILPGQVFFAAGINALLRCTATKPSTESGNTEIDAAVDVFGSSSASEAGKRLYNKRLSPQPEPNYLEAVVQRPSLRLVFPHQAAHDKVAGCTVYISTNGTDFSYLGSIQRSSWAGELESGLSAAATGTIVQTTPIGITQKLDLSSDAARFNAGGQVALIGDPLGLHELVYVESITEISSERHQLNNMLRGRESTPAVAWSAQTPVFGFLDTELRLNNAAVQPSAALWFKLAPVTGAGELPLSECTPIGPFTVT